MLADDKLMITDDKLIRAFYLVFKFAKKTTSSLFNKTRQFDLSL